ncbi:Uncharacterized protein dnm_097200 [Desulfonema magnum]|uniref:Uncharacterized protein n=1 Tax=Desulfonema magnum TaxID=45655 RepID=A0A975BXL9_9BACT|nr:Uncharacterized protein dnm_097200 [Desulfonema magnum]
MSYINGMRFYHYRESGNSATRIFAFSRMILPANEFVSRQ